MPSRAFQIITSPSFINRHASYGPFERFKIRRLTFGTASCWTGGPLCQCPGVSVRREHSVPQDHVLVGHRVEHLACNERTFRRGSYDLRDDQTNTVGTIPGSQLGLMVRAARPASAQSGKRCHRVRRWPFLEGSRLLGAWGTSEGTFGGSGSSGVILRYSQRRQWDR